MPHLRLVPPREPTPKEALALRIKRMPKPNCVLQCNRCGSNTSLTVFNGTHILNGRVHPGTVIYRHVCEQCYIGGVIQFMLPDPPRLVKPRKPRKTKPRLVK